MRILLAVLVWPLIEIGLFVTVGGAIGLWWTLAVVLGTAVLGVAILRNAARLTGGAALRDPRAAVMTATRGGMTLLAGILLILPGFLTDALGLILLLPPVQLVVARLLAARIRVATPRPAASRKDDLIEGEFERVDAADAPPPSGWTKG